MLPRLLGAAAAALSAAVAAAADPLLLPAVALLPDNPPAATAPANPTVRPAPDFLRNPAADVSPGFTPAPPAAQPELPLPVRPSGLPPAAQPKDPKPAGSQPPIPPTGSPLPPPGTVNQPAPAAVPAADGCGGCDPLTACVICPAPWDPYWVQAGYTLLWIKPAPIPPALAATGPLGPGTRVLLGGTDRQYGGFDGVLLGGGVWFDPQHKVGLGLSGFWTGKQGTSEVLASDGTGAPAIARPFFNPQLVGLGGQDAILVSDPGRFAGSLTVETGAQVAGGEANLLLGLVNTSAWTSRLVLGFRYFDLDETLTVTQATRGLNGNTIPFFGNTAGVTAVTITDHFRTRNQFYGGQVGLETEYRAGPVFLDGGVKVGFGPVHQVTEVSGQTLGPGGTGGVGGVLAVGSIPQGNVGRTTTNRFAVLADVNGMLGVQLNSRFRIAAGYDFLYLNSVARPGHQVVTTIDPRLIPVSPSFGGRIPAGTAQSPPFTPFDRDDFFVHGVRVLLEFDF